MTLQNQVFKLYVLVKSMYTKWRAPGAQHFCSKSTSYYNAVSLVRIIYTEWLAPRDPLPSPEQSNTMLMVK